MGRYLIPLLLDGWVLLIVIVMDVCGGRCIIPTLDNEGRMYVRASYSSLLELVYFALPQG
jgi:hypothetical protein